MNIGISICEYSFMADGCQLFAYCMVIVTVHYGSERQAQPVNALALASLGDTIRK